MHYRMLFGFYGGMALLACCVGYAFGVFDDSPSWLGTPGARDCGLGVVFALFAAFLMLLLSKRVAFMENLYVELSQALPPRDWRWNATAGILSGFAEEFAFRGVALDLIGPVLLDPRGEGLAQGFEADDEVGDHLGLAVAPHPHRDHPG